jgi:hypothetical protein
LISGISVFGILISGFLISGFVVSDFVVSDFVTSGFVVSGISVLFFEHQVRVSKVDKTTPVIMLLLFDEILKEVLFTPFSFPFPFPFNIFFISDIFFKD